MDANIIPNYNVMFDDGMRPYTYIPANDICFTYKHLVAGLKMIANDIARINYSVGTNQAVRANNCL